MTWLLTHSASGRTETREATLPTGPTGPTRESLSSLNTRDDWQILYLSPLGVGFLDRYEARGRRIVLYYSAAGQLTKKTSSNRPPEAMP